MNGLQKTIDSLKTITLGFILQLKNGCFITMQPFLIVLLVPVRIIFLPTPCVFTHFFYAALCFPSKYCVCFACISINFIGVTGSSRIYNIWNIGSGDIDKSISQLQNACSVSGSEVKRLASLIFKSPFNRFNMAYGKIYNMNIISYSRAVNRIIIVPENMEFFKLPNRNLRNIWHKIIGNSLGVFAYGAAFMSSYG